jgi:hypothetical protein
LKNILEKERIKEEKEGNRERQESKDCKVHKEESHR